MRFGPVPVGAAAGTIVAHAVHADGLVLKKGDLVRPEHVAALTDLGVDRIIVAQLERDDVGENAAARRIAEAVGGTNVTLDRPFTGRANLFAKANGILRLDTAAIDHLNAVDEAVTLATLPNYRTVEIGEMIGTVKIIPFAIAGSVLAKAIKCTPAPIIDVAPFQPLRVAVVSTVLPGLKPQVISKTLKHLAARLQPAGGTIVADERVAHDVVPLVHALRSVVATSDLVVVFGASAITDRRDVIPAAVEAAGGEIEHFGMPVDPGNLLLLSSLQGKPVIGAPGCARSPKENGFDWVLHRLLAGVPVTKADVRGLGVGGLLMEIVTRPQPRTGDAPRSVMKPLPSDDTGDSALA